MKRNAFTLVEILVALAVISIVITGSAVTYNKSWQNNQIDICESDLRDLSSGFSSFFIDYGNIIIKPDANYETVLNETINILNKQYLTNQIVVTEIATDKKSVKLTTKNKSDPWGSKYNFNIYTYDGDDKDSISGLILIYSIGADGKSSHTTYKDQNFGDDVIAIVEPK
jgi:prepilin-type N-terminal cleavage/methylation domain-containing protein